MTLYRDVTDKPWNTVGLPDGIDPKPTFQAPNEKVALIVFVIVASVLFSLLTVSYYLRILWGGGDWVPIAEPAMLWVNTGVLIAASIMFHLALIQGRRQTSVRFPSAAALSSLTGGILTLLFIIGQNAVWQTLVQSGLTLQSNPANSFFYLLTGVHILHLIGGLWVWSRAQLRMMRKNDIEQTRLSLELCAWYWHFLLLVWFGLFYVLSTT
ncbi:cytochrome c oxidase subunit 3 [Pseudohongiella spirulinae]|uniref:Cytochrome C oxidase n=1 Tax=Pseudohongiella spirulinae TaxID=1249552 RepID=A0A0S2K8Z9_9GAMM|nr:cytochrome c oxidase subunit 3 [Pseudohongiella spirulinae]ALO44728.1 cytochrome C oxidase [Pseudohongiella spirulinae]